MNEYQDYATAFNKIAGGQNLASGVEPLTISTRGAHLKSMGGLKSMDLDRRNRMYELMKRFQQDQIKKSTEPGLFDFLGLIPGVGSVIGGLEDRHNVGKTKKQDIFEIMGL